MVEGLQALRGLIISDRSMSKNEQTRSWQPEEFQTNSSRTRTRKSKYFVAALHRSSSIVSTEIRSSQSARFQDGMKRNDILHEANRQGSHDLPFYPRS